MGRPAPDGGWGWVIVACSFFFHLSAVGVVYSISVLYVSWVEDFQTGRGVTAWVLTLTIAMCVSIGPIVASLGARFSYRVVVIAGAIMQALGFFLSYFATSVYHLIITIGVLSGCGLGMGYLPAIAILPTYFDKKRAIAVGIGTSGVGVGAFILPPFLTWLEEVYTWRGTMLIVSGITLNMCVFGALMRPVQYPTYEETILDADGVEINDIKILFDAKEDEGFDGADSNFSEQKTFTDDDGHLSQCKCKGISPHSSIQSINSSVTGHSLRCIDANHIGAECQCNKHIPGVMSISESQENKSVISSGYKSNSCSTQDFPKTFSSQPVTKTPHTVKNGTLFPTFNHHSGLLNIDHDRKNIHNKHLQKLRPLTSHGIGGSFQHIGTGGQVDFGRRNFSSVNELHRPPSKLSIRFKGGSGVFHPDYNHVRNSHMDLMLSGSIYNVLLLDKHFHPAPSLNSKLSTSIAIHDPLLENANITSIEVMPAADMETEPQEKPKSSLSIYCILLKNPFFLVVAFCNVLTNLSYLMPIIYMVDRAVDNGITKVEASLALSLYGAGNLLGRPLMGWLVDCFGLDHLVSYFMCLSMCGLVTCLSPLCYSSLPLHAIYGLSFGLFIGGYVTLTPLVLVELLGVDLVGQSYGLLLAFQGVATLLGTPLAGWMFDWTTSYTISFIIHGLFLLCAAMLLVPLKVAIHRKRQESKQEKETHLDE